MSRAVAVDRWRLWLSGLAPEVREEALEWWRERASIRQFDGGQAAAVAEIEAAEEVMRGMSGL